jgi:alkanesulfonate monooxygenase SsuD/methylene tetrahydromethanopterin reductase-like flavin-dependent oxidoreductase (luciferase family)
MRPLKVGVQLPEVEREVRWPELRDMARAAQSVGFDSLWLGDHLLYRRPNDRARGPWEVWTSLAGLAEATDRITLGPLVACTSFHEPAMLAKMAATVDEISGGRLILGLGAGWNETDYRAFGFPFDQRISRFEEAFTIIRTLLREGAIDFDGRFYQARDCELLPRGPRPSGPPLMVGSIGPRMLRITMPHVDGWNVWYADTHNSPAGVHRCARSWMRPATRSDATRRTSNAPSPSSSACPVAGGGRRATQHRPHCRLWLARPRSSRTGCAPTAARASPMSSSCSIPSRRPRSRTWRPSSPTSTGAEEGR